MEDPLKKAFYAPAINLDDRVGLLSGSGLPSETDDGSIPVGSLYLRTLGELYLKTDLPTLWKKITLQDL